MEDYSSGQGLRNILGKRSFHITLIVFLFFYYSFVYYLGEIIDIFGWDALRWNFFYGVHDVQRVFFLVPVIYTGYVFRIKWALIISFASFLAFLPRALFISPFSDPSLRIVLFTILASIVGTLTGMVRNETERRTNLEKMVKTERDKMLGILERMEDGVLIVGPEYVIRFLNPSMVREFGEGVGIPCNEYLGNLEEFCIKLRKFRGNINKAPDRNEYTSKDGITYDIITSPFLDTSGEVCQLATFRNITQRKKVENRLLELNQMKSDLLSNVSHELRSPLTSIKGAVGSLLEKDIQLDKETNDMLLTGISEETDRLISLVTNLLNMSRLESGIWKPEKEICYVQDIVTRVLEKQRWAGRKYTYETHLIPDLPAIFADGNQIEQVLTNLLENAAAYSEEGSIITISAEADDKMVEIVVSDTGTGIPEEDFDKIFEKFYRGNRDRQKPGGTGLGLAICKTIITKHKGKIWVESAVGKGTDIHFTIPIARPAGTGKNV